MVVSIPKPQNDTVDIEAVLKNIAAARIVSVKETNENIIVVTELKTLFAFQLAIFRNYHPETCTVSFVDNYLQDVYETMFIIDDKKDDKLVIGGLEFKGDCYVSSDKNGTTLWTSRPTLKDNEYVGDGTPAFYPSTIAFINDGSAIHVLTGEADGDKTFEVSLKGLYKLTMRNVKE